MERPPNFHNRFRAESWRCPERSRLGQAVLFLALLVVFWSPFSGGARVPSFLLVALGGVLLWRKRWSEAPSLARERLGQVFLLLWLPVLLSVPGSVHFRSSLSVAVALPFYGLMGLALLWGFRTADGLDWLERGIGLCLSLWLVDGWVQYLFGRDLLGIPLGEESRVVGFFHGLRLSVFLSVLAPLLLWRLTRSKPGFAWSLYILLVTIVILGGARSSWVMAALAGVLLFARLSWGWKIKLAVGATTAILVLSVVAGSERVRVKVEQSMATGVLGFTALDRITSGRMTIWVAGMRMVLDHPWVGVGAGAFTEAYDAYSTRSDDPFRSGGAEGLSHAHHLYVAVAAETGLIGLGSLIAIWWLCSRWYRQGTAVQRARAGPWGAALVIAVFPLNSQPIAFSVWWFPVLLLLLSGFLGALNVPDSVGEARTGA